MDFCINQSITKWKKIRETSENITQSGDLRVILDFEDAKIGQSLQTQIRRQRVNTRREPW